LVPKIDVFTGASTGRQNTPHTGNLFHCSKAVGHADLTTAGTTQTISFDVAPTNAYKHDAHIDITTAWTVGGGDATALGLEFGDAGDPNGLLLTKDLVSGGPTGWEQLGGLGAEYRDNLIESAFVPALKFTASGGASPLVTDADAGALVAYCNMLSLYPAYGFQSAFEPVLKLDTTGGNTNTLIAGKVFVYVEYALVPRNM
jgi:hypothetical protein